MLLGLVESSKSTLDRSADIRKLAAAISMETVKEWKICRYKNSGKLFTIDPATGCAYPLNLDYSFSSQKPHRIRYRTTPIEDTEYRMEIEEIRQPSGRTGLRCIRIYSA